jgi:hypothetical protein
MCCCDEAFGTGISKERAHGLELEHVLRGSTSREAIEDIPYALVGANAKHQPASPLRRGITGDDL